MSMKIQFDANLDYQRDAIESVTGVFAGQKSARPTYGSTAAFLGKKARFMVFRKIPRVLVTAYACWMKTSMPISAKYS